MDVQFIKQFLACIANSMQEHKEYLIQLDSVVGDGDLGLTMSDGFCAASTYAHSSNEQDIGKLLYMAGKAMSIAVPSTMGTLMASGLMQAGKDGKGKQALSDMDIISLLKAFETGVANRGKAKVGEKTFIDGLHPAIEAMYRSIHHHETLIEAAKKGADGAMEGYECTAGMLAVHGRAATRGEDSRALKDPGAYVAVLIMQAFVQALKG